MSQLETRQAVEAVFRIERVRLIAGLARIVRDIGLAEELAQDALLVALQVWPGSGVPANPGAWLMTTAKRRALDYFRRNKMAARKLDELGYDLRGTEATTPDLDTPLDDDIRDDILRLIFTSCHPALSEEGRIALTLRVIGGLKTDEIARAFLLTEATVAQRIVRAKRNLAEAGLPFEVPRGEERGARLASVLEVLYLIFNEGYAATAGEDWTRPLLCEEAMRLGRILAGLMPDSAAVHALLALMELQASRLPARLDAIGQPILLLDQNRSRWNHMLIQRGLAGLGRVDQLGGANEPYALQAGIAACHARAARAADTDWTRIAGLYDRLAVVTPSPVIELNRAMAHAMAFGPALGLAIADSVADDPRLAGYHLLPTVRADLLEKLGRTAEARAEFERAAGLTRSERERLVLLERAAVCAGS
jgi:RNA polymerase sigma factor (sigma-70 family)